MKVDYREFCKLYPVKIPVLQHATYYLETLQKSDEFDWIPEYLKGFTEMQEALGDERIKDFKMRMLEKLKARIQGSKAYERFQNMNLDAPARPEQNLRDVIGHFLLSIDIKSANYTMLSCFDLDDEFPSTWGLFCAQEGVPLPLIQSKKFRQVVFGNCNPRRNQHLQRRYMTALTYALEVDELFEVVFFSNDEIILDLGPIDQEPHRIAQTVQLVRETIRTAGVDPHNIPGRALLPLVNRVELSFELFSMHHIGKKKYVRTWCLDDTTVTHKTLSGVPGHKFFMYFKRYILEEPLEEPDFLFVVDEQVARWQQPPWPDKEWPKK